MKAQIIILGLILLGIWTNVSGQNVTPTINPQLFVIKADDKTLITDSNGISVKEDDANSNSLVYVNPNWIESMEVIKGKDATDKYGLRGQNGVIIMTLSKDGFNKMRLGDKEKFKKNG
jgi:hypothetical protein